MDGSGDLLFSLAPGRIGWGIETWQEGTPAPALAYKGTSLGEGVRALAEKEAAFPGGRGV